VWRKSGHAPASKGALQRRATQIGGVCRRSEGRASMGAREEAAAVDRGGAKRGGEAVAHTIATVHVLEPHQLSSSGSVSGTV
jgi:hypothetical protein